MMWPKAKLIFLREVRDQLRDRRTLFMILVLPIILYPALGLGLFQLTLSFGKQQRTIGIVGKGDLPDNPPLLSADGKSFDDRLVNKGRFGDVHAITDDDLSRKDIKDGRVDAILEIPPGMKERLAKGEQVPVRILFNGTNDRSEMARTLLRSIVLTWSEEIVDERVKSAGYPESFAEPISIADGVEDVSTTSGRSGTAWSRMFPFLLVMMALTGAFYPAVDLCAGEKERGTMETLLISPASRGEIVLGKFLTIFVFSVATTIVNLTSMGITFAQTARMIPSSAQDVMASVFSPPSFGSVFWMFVLMLPMSAFFSALCMALAIFARSTKEGQYYLMPLFLIVTPLVFITLAPGVELTPFYSLIPVTNVALLLKTFMLNQYETAAIYFIPVLAPTLLYGFLALRYAADQFNREDVLFREAERFDLKQWVVRSLTEKPTLTTFRQAWGFFIVYMMFRWYTSGWWTTLSAQTIIASQLVTLLLPAILFAFFLTSKPFDSLGLRKPSTIPLIASLLLIVALHPVALMAGTLLEKLMPIENPEGLQHAVNTLMDRPLWQTLLLAAVLPAVTEELVFRGIILGGLLQRYRPPLAILVSSVLFGVSHMIPQQMILTTLVGIVLGIIATRTGSVWASMIAHALHNGILMVVAGNAKEDTLRYPGILVVAAAIVSVILLAYLIRLPARVKRSMRPIHPSTAPSAVVYEPA
ncbi:CPBP family intramembrane metalloprotease [bacterium]|nr:CPBP family intramembrane metalloprotease [bacterium]